MYKVYQRNGLFGLLLEDAVFINPNFKSIERTHDAYIFDGMRVRREYLEGINLSHEDKCYQHLKNNKLHTKVHKGELFQKLRAITRIHNLSEKDMVTDVHLRIA